MIKEKLKRDYLNEDDRSFYRVVKTLRDLKKSLNIL